MDTTYTDITIVIDRSGSMASLKTGADEGLADFIKAQSAIGGKVLFSLWQFDQEIEKVYEELALPPEHLLVPRGLTALYDGVNDAIESTGARLALLEEAKRPARVVFLIVSDGFENASSRTTAKQLSDKIKRQQNDYNWQFVFIGTNQDAIASAGAIGIRGQAALNYSSSNTGIHQAYVTASAGTEAYVRGTVQNVAFTEADRKKNREGDWDLQSSANLSTKADLKTPA